MNYYLFNILVFLEGPKKLDYIMLTQRNNATILDTFNLRSMDLLGLEQVHPLFGHKFG